MDNDSTYYRRRAAQERERAALATDAAVRNAHEALAREYEQRAGGKPARLSAVYETAP
ncbi:hypothetical protein ABC347_10995 [Sphingomonas sp. 1P06PA]|uniref:hypothetical protein n=1 Tax=Sphingomonas sp. 1P06PA TaxID=554121 RepID=UPI0039A4F871